MKSEFFQFRPEDIKNCIRIKSTIRYDTLSVLIVDTPLKKSPVFSIARGKKWYDLVQFDDSLNFAISERLKDILEKNKISGWSCFPVQILGTNLNYYAFLNLGKAGPILNLEALNKYETESIEFDIKTWNGADIFNLSNTLVNACTEKVKKLIEAGNISNVEINPL